MKIPKTKEEWLWEADDCLDWYADHTCELNEERIWELLVLASRHLKEKE